MKKARLILFFLSLAISVLAVDSFHKDSIQLPVSNEETEILSFDMPVSRIPREFAAKEYSSPSGFRTITVFSGVFTALVTPTIIKKGLPSVSVHRYPESHLSNHSFYSIRNIRI